MLIDIKEKGKIKMKRIIAIALFACMTIALAGCSQTDTSEKVESAGQVSIAESSVESKTESSAESKSDGSSAQESSKTEESSKAEESSDSAEESSEQPSEDDTAAQQASEQKAAEEKAASEKAAAEKAAAEKAAAEKAAAEKAAAEKAAAEKAAAEKAAAEKAAQQAAEQQAAQQSANGSFSSSDLAMKYNGKTVALMTSAGNAVSALGNASSKENLPSCLSLDAPDDIVYHYNGFTVQTLTDNGNEKVYIMDITGGSATTAKGIGIGSSAADIENAYGKASEADDFIIRYTVDGGKNSLEFYLENGKVNEIIIANTP